MSQMPETAKKSEHILNEVRRILEENGVLESRSPMAVLQSRFDAAIAQRDELLEKVAYCESQMVHMRKVIMSRHMTADKENAKTDEKCQDWHDPHKVWGHEYWVVLNSQKRENLEDFIGSPFGARNACAIGDHVQYMPDCQPVSSRPHKYDDSRPSKGS